MGLGYFVFFRFRVYRFLYSRIQSLGFSRGFKLFLGVLQGQYDLGFLKVQCLVFLRSLSLGFGFCIQGFSLRVCLGLRIQVKAFIQVFRAQGFGFFRLTSFRVFIGLGFRVYGFLFYFLGFSIYNLALYKVQSIEFFQVIGFLGF